MKPSFEKISIGEERSLLVKKFTCSYFDALYHFHPEYELTYIVRGHGQRFVGDSVEDFKEGDLVLLGSNLAHFWRSDASYYQAPDPSGSEAIVIHFSEKLVDPVLGMIPEFSVIQSLWRRAPQGVAFASDNEAFGTIRELLLSLSTTTRPAEQILLFLRLLTELATFPETRMLASEGYVPRLNEAETERMRRILDYTLQHFREPIGLPDIAKEAHLSEAAFCRYFRQRTQKPYLSYLNELRVGHARQLLIASSMSVGQIALDSGFQNLSHFHRLFRRFTGYSPLRYRQIYQLGAKTSPSAS
ncbi:AraC family transcriptional regulator [Telluribacter sp. SYSU D00476]|uniref:helix-turn-helix domain-containing protein n=1 Tax=Telluribacter sp. SYSU D00476 TaxID=2811430 RepID=UPI001FF370A0|nr:AraC family transcriptional regulator [Telluribacter sp. SYSU D00476]